MLKKSITFEDFNGETVTEVHYFNLSKAELIEMEVSYDEGFAEHMQNIITARDSKALIKEFKEIILMAFGEKSADGKRFVKNAEIREAFSQTAAYQHLFMELATDDEVAAEFIIGVVPKDMAVEIEKIEKKTAAKVADDQAKKTTAEIAAEQEKKVEEVPTT